MKFSIFLILLFIILLTGCYGGISSQYLLTMDYTNPKTDKIATINIPVSQYEYEQIAVGTPYTATIHTSLMGVTIPVNKQISLTGAYMAEQMPAIGFVLLVFMTIYMSYAAKSLGSIIRLLIFVVVVLGVILLMISPMQPEFTTTGTIIDKTFKITSY
jgi:hypothetical protein